MRTTLQNIIKKQLNAIILIFVFCVCACSPSAAVVASIEAEITPSIEQSIQASLEQEFIESLSAIPNRQATTTFGADYILNRNTKKFHYPDCSSVNQMLEKNKIYFEGKRQEVIEKGYEPCGRCRP